MLIGIDPLLSPDLLHALRSMGHRQDVAIVDANFPCDPARCRVVRLDGVSAPDTLAAVLSVMPVEIDDATSDWRMIADSDPDLILPVFADFAPILDQHARGRPLTAVEPDEFAERASASYVTVITGERRPYGGIILRKDVVPPLHTRAWTSVAEDSREAGGRRASPDQRAEDDGC